MKRLGPPVLVFVFAVLTSGVVTVRASDPVGIYAVIEKVVLEPGVNAPERIQVWGAFTISDGKPGDNYSAPHKGYLYFTAPVGKEEVSRKEWADLKSLAGTGQGVAFAHKYEMKTRLRKAEEKPAAPDVYPLGMGIAKIGSERQAIVALKELLRQK